MKVEIADSGEQDSLFSKNTAIKPEGDITKAISVEIPQEEMDLILQRVSGNLSREFTERLRMKSLREASFQRQKITWKK